MTLVQRALPPGAVRRRTFFGLMDADGWTAAFLKALFWFAVIILLLGYIPDRAYYFTVSPTIDVGYNAVSPINFCDAGNRTLPCPAPAGAFVPWEASPQELALPAPRSGGIAVQSGENLYLVGGRINGQPTADVAATRITTTGNFGSWATGPALPAPRADTAIVSFAGVPYVIGGLDASGAPTDAVYRGKVESGALTGWEPVDSMKLPQPLSGATAVATARGFYLLGGRGSDGALSQVVYRSILGDAQPPVLGAWTDAAQLRLPEPRASAPGVVVGEFIYLLGGEGPNGPTRSVMRLEITTAGEPRSAAGSAAPRGWAMPGPGQDAQNLPGERVGATVYTANSAVYVIGGADAGGQPVQTSYWAVPDPTTGDIPEWRHLDQMDLPEARRNAAISVAGSYGFLIGGESTDGPRADTVRANISPKPPFFRLGLFGATIPALSIKGEIGQQLGYINAFTVGMVNFTVLVIIGIAMSHRRGTQRVLSRVTRGRVKAPPEETVY